MKAQRKKKKRVKERKGREKRWTTKGNQSGKNFFSIDFINEINLHKGGATKKLRSTSAANIIFFVKITLKLYNGGGE